MNDVIDVLLKREMWWEMRLDLWYAAGTLFEVVDPMKVF